MNLSYYELDYEADRKKHEVFISSEGLANAITVTLPPEVTYPGYIALMRGGAVIGELDATFDFSKLDPSLHELAFCLIANSERKAVHICI